jgi:hypothetical protein
LITVPSERFPDAQLAGAIGFLHSLYTPLIVREAPGGFVKKADLLGILELNSPTNQLQPSKPICPNGSLVNFLQSVQSAFDVCRDIGDGVSLEKKGKL